MVLETSKTLSQWAVFLAREPLPVLQISLTDLAILREDEQALSALAVSRIVLRDPMLTAHVLRYLEQHRSRYQQEIVEVEQAILMLGMEPFYQKVLTGLESVEGRLVTEPEALTHLQGVLTRVHRAAEYAREWSVRLNDRHYGEVYVAALLHDVAEAVLWTFAPQSMLRIHRLQQNDKALRSRDVQIQVLGFPLRDLQRELVARWGLPSLLATLMEDEKNILPRVRTVTLAINLARHSSHGWDDAALPDDMTEISQLLRISRPEVRALVKARSD